MGNITGFLILCGVFVILLVLYLQSTKKKQYPTRLNMTKKAPGEGAAEEASAIPLNVMFNYNGHAFDAYQVLGVPAGSSWDEVREAFSLSLSTNEQGSHEFFKAAFEAIKKSYKF